MAKAKGSISFGLRLPDPVHDIVVRRAGKAGMSVNEYLVRIIRHEVERSHHKDKSWSSY